MRGVWRLTWNEFKINLRDPMMVFWCIAYPALWLILMAKVIPGPIPGFAYAVSNNADLVFPASVSLVILSTSFIGAPLTLTNYRETAVLRRFRVTPVKTITLALSFSITQFAFVLAGISVLLIIGTILGVQVRGSWLAFTGVIISGIITFLAIGSAIGSIAKSFRSANIIIWTIFMPMMLLSELFLPLSILPAWLQPIAKVLPLTPITTMLRDIVYGVPLGDLWRLGVMAVWIILAGIITARFFQWE
jgi:ABC-2 type transport system permease protein